MPKHVDTGASAQKLADLKAAVRQRHVVNFFTSPEDLAAKVTQDIVRLIGAMGKVPTAQVLSQIAANAVKRHPLTQPRFEFLKGKVKHVFVQDVPDTMLREALELAIGGDNMAAAFVLSRGTQMPLDDAVDGLMEIEKVLIDIIQQGQSRLAGTKDV